MAAGCIEEAVCVSDEKIDNQGCEGCSYSGYNPTLGLICEYILCTGKMRPCPAGSGCTVRTTAKIPRDEERWTTDFVKKGRSAGEGTSAPLPG